MSPQSFGKAIIKMRKNLPKSTNKSKRDVKKLPP